MCISLKAWAILSENGISWIRFLPKWKFIAWYEPFENEMKMEQQLISVQLTLTPRLFCINRSISANKVEAEEDGERERKKGQYLFLWTFWFRIQQKIEPILGQMVFNFSTILRFIFWPTKTQYRNQWLKWGKSFGQIQMLNVKRTCNIWFSSIMNIYLFHSIQPFNKFDTILLECKSEHIEMRGRERERDQKIANTLYSGRNGFQFGWHSHSLPISRSLSHSFSHSLSAALDECERINWRFHSSMMKMANGAMAKNHFKIFIFRNVNI